MNSLEQLNIKHLSCSSLSKWHGDRGAWVASYVYGLWDEGGPGLWRGKAVEAALDGWHKGASDEDCIAHMSREFESGAQGECDDGKIDKERASLLPMFREAQAAWASNKLPEVKASQIRTELWADGVPVPIIGYLDFAVDGNYCVDLKTTHRCPSSLSGNHLLQISSYAKARGEKKAGIMYVTAKKSAYYEIGEAEIDSAVKELERRAIGLYTTLQAAASFAEDNGEDIQGAIAKMCPPEPSSFYWSDAEYLAKSLQNIPAWT